ncbi:MAG: hypothetical protein WD738_04670 [Pirellulales bacterium]
MGKSSVHSIAIGQAVVLGVVALCAASGCWEEIEYTGPDPSTVAHRQPPPSADDEPPAEANEPTSSTASRLAERQLPPSSDPEPALPNAQVAPSATGDTAEDAEDRATAEGVIVNKTPVADAESEPVPPADLETTTTSGIAELAPSAPALTTRRAAWQLGSKLSLAALAHDRGMVPDSVATWFNEARSAAEALGTSVDELPEAAAATATEGEGASRRVHDYLFQQGQRIWRDLTDRHGRDHAALFEMAVKSNVLLVLYSPESPAVQSISTAVAEAGPRAELPPELWRPLLDTLANKSTATEVRTAVRRLHADVDQYLSAAAEQ